MGPKKRYSLTILALCIALASSTVEDSASPAPAPSYGGDAAPPSKILVLIPISSPSHRNVFRPLVQALAERGHKVDDVRVFSFGLRLDSFNYKFVLKIYRV